MSGNKIKRDLPNNQYQAAINASNPSASNPFVTGNAVGVVAVFAGSTGNSNTVNNSNAETNIITNNFDFPILANNLVVGDRIRITMFGQWGTGAAIRNLNFRLKLNGVTILGSKAIELPINQTNRGVWITADIAIRSIGVGGTCIAGMSVSLANSSTATSVPLGDITPSIGTKPINTTIVNTFNFSVQWSGGAPSANNTITFEEIIYEKLRV